MSTRTGLYVVLPGGGILNTQTGIVVAGVNVEELTPHEAAIVADVIAAALDEHAIDLSRKGVQ